MTGHRIIRLQAENVKKLVAIDITPTGDVVTIAGKNANGKSSVLDAIYMALGGKDAAPPKPVRNGEDRGIIKVGLGREAVEVTVVRTFDADGQTTLRVETADGAKYSAPQKMLDDLVGRISFDPLEFARMAPADQVAELRRIVPLAVDLDQLAADDKADYAARRDINRDVTQLRNRIDAIVVVEGLPAEAPDLDAIQDRLATAADTNTAIERDRLAREDQARQAGACDTMAENAAKEAERLREAANRADAESAHQLAEAKRIKDALDALPPLDEPVDTNALREELAKGQRLAGLIGRRQERDGLQAEHDTLKGQADALTDAMTARAETRAKALADAKMPVPGLSLATEGDDTLVTFNGVPFEQASSAEQLRVSTALAMAANPKLRVLRVRDGALLDDEGLGIITEMAKAGDFQVWLEVVGDRDGVGIIMEDGAVRGAPLPESIADEGPRRRKPKADDDAPQGDDKPADGKLL